MGVPAQTFLLLTRRNLKLIKAVEIFDIIIKVLHVTAMRIVEHTPGTSLTTVIDNHDIVAAME